MGLPFPKFDHETIYFLNSENNNVSKLTSSFSIVAWKMSGWGNS